MQMVANTGAGQFIAMPDVCTTPPAPGTPVPYTNIALNAQATGFAPNVLTSMQPTLTQLSQVPMSSGDEAGSLHPTVKGAATIKAGLFPVFIKFVPIATLTTPTSGNNFNAPMGTIAVPSATNVFVCQAPPLEMSACRRESASSSDSGEAGEAGICGDGGSSRAASTGYSVAQIQAMHAALSGASGPSVESRMIDDTRGYLRIRVFSIDVPARVLAAVRTLTRCGMQELVMDLRGNRGGELRAFVELAGDFLPVGTLIGRLVEDDGDEHIYRASQPEPYLFPLTIVVDRHTASAAELFAACLQTHGRSTVFGEPTFGKTTGQRVSSRTNSSGKFGTQLVIFKT